MDAQHTDPSHESDGNNSDEESAGRNGAPDGKRKMTEVSDEAGDGGESSPAISGDEGGYREGGDLAKGAEREIPASFEKEGDMTTATGGSSSEIEANSSKANERRGRGQGRKRKRKRPQVGGADSRSFVPTPKSTGRHTFPPRWQLEMECTPRCAAGRCCRGISGSVYWVGRRIPSHPPGSRRCKASTSRFVSRPGKRAFGTGSRS
mmetsp:Transcript_53443/g.159922  ORF Transcript_53443/g.159922 Transcript_53443/m.159922 type:complete len:206 (+) Transcript_53443:1026-1643(+)